MIQVVTNAEATNTNGESKQGKKLKRIESIASASGRGEAIALSAEDISTRAPVIAAIRPCLGLSMTIPIVPLVAAVIHGESSHIPTLTPRRSLKFAACVLMPSGALSVRGSAKADAVGLL